MKKAILEVKDENNVVNLANSVLSYFGIKPYHNTLPVLDEILKDHPNKKIVILLLDGMGANIVEHYKKVMPYLYSKIVTKYNTIFPPTTVAATSSITTGKYPIENGAIGWTQYFKDYDEPINVFTSVNPFTKVAHTPNTYDQMNVDYIWDAISNTGKYHADHLMAERLRDNDSDPITIEIFERFFKKTENMLKENDFIYAYCNCPDHFMHSLGMYNKTIREQLSYFDKRVKQFVEENPNVIMLVTPDHGFTSVTELSVYEHQDFLDTLKLPYYLIEARFAGFKVKNKEKFIELANKYYSKYFYICSYAELQEMHTFGYGNPSRYFEETKCDYYLISKNKQMFSNDKDPKFKFAASHAGGTKKEKEIYLMVAYK